MKKLTLLLTGFLALTLNAAFADDAPRGALLEVHSCELYAGGCTYSGEAPQDGRYMVRAWDFTGGTFNKTDFKGLQIAILQASPDNLAAKDSKSTDAVVYLPQTATTAQRDALIAWIQSTQPDLKSAKLQTRTAPLQFTKTEHGYTFSAGKFITVKTVSMESCDAFACGAALWYEPRTAANVYTVVVNEGSAVAEPLLKLNWTDSGKRSVFLGRFGESASSKEVFVTMSELCGAKSLF